MSENGKGTHPLSGKVRRADGTMAETAGADRQGGSASVTPKRENGVPGEAKGTGMMADRPTVGAVNRAERLEEAVGRLPDAMLMQALLTEDAEALARLTEREERRRHRIRMRTVSLAASFLLILGGIGGMILARQIGRDPGQTPGYEDPSDPENPGTPGGPDEPGDMVDPPLTSSPMEKMDGKAQLEEELGWPVPVLPERTVSEWRIYNNIGRSFMAEICYEDGGVFRKAADAEGWISGVTPDGEAESLELSGVSVCLMTCRGYFLTEWRIGDYSYSLFCPEKSREEVLRDTETLIRAELASDAK